MVDVLDFELAKARLGAKHAVHTINRAGELLAGNNRGVCVSLALCDRISGRSPRPGRA
ncbi:hypothetical protein ACVDG8_008105 [Mesorhizobium sp. ORM8.1]